MSTVSKAQMLRAFDKTDEHTRANSRMNPTGFAKKAVGGEALMSGEP